MKPTFKLLATRIGEISSKKYKLKDGLDNYPTVEEANEGLDALKAEIEGNYPLKSDVPTTIKEVNIP